MADALVSGTRPSRVLFLFVDGVGIGDADPATNPFLGAALPTLRRMLGGREPVRGELDAPGADGDAAWAAADATLGVAGLPQSGTGQTALLTGINAAERFGRHFGPWVPTGLRGLLAEENVLTRAAAAGRRVAFANATPLAQLGGGSGEWRRPAAPPLAARAAGAYLRGLEDLRRGRAIASSITHERWRAHADPALPEIEPARAGAVLAALSTGADLTLFAHYDLDFVGHRRDRAAAVAALQRLDEFLRGVLDALPGDALLVTGSDHGNVEDLTQGHTRNPVPVLAVGRGAADLTRGVRAITDVAPAILRFLGIN